MQNSAVKRRRARLRSIGHAGTGNPASQLRYCAGWAQAGNTTALYNRVVARVNYGTPEAEPALLNPSTTPHRRNTNGHGGGLQTGFQSWRVTQ